MEKIEVVTIINGKESRRTVTGGATMEEAQEYAELITLQGPAEYAAVKRNGVIIAEYEQ